MAVVDIGPLLDRVTRPARYMGAEWNARPLPTEEASLKILLVDPDVYEVGMSRSLFHSLYQLLNSLPGVTCHRAFLPWPDMAMAMRESATPLWSLEGRQPALEFDLLLVLAPSELCLPSIIELLSLSGLPPLRQDRSGGPVVAVCAPAFLNPAPFSPLADMVLLGDPEAILPTLVISLQDVGLDPSRLKGMSGVFDCSLQGTARAVCADLLPSYPTRHIVAFVETVQDALVVELARGDGETPYAGGNYYWGPYRERSPSEIMESVSEALANTGYREVVLKGTHYGKLQELAHALRQSVGREVAIRTLQIPAQASWVEAATLLWAVPPRGSLNLWVGASSQRLRDALGFPLSDEEILAAAQSAFLGGWTSIRLQLEVGVPGEKPADVDAFLELIGNVKRAGRAIRGPKAHVRIEAAIFVPRPFTPFQWAPLPSLDEVAHQVGILRHGCRRKGIDLAVERPERWLVATAVARGDEEVAEAALHAWRLGARWDMRRDAFVWSSWEEAFRRASLEASTILAGRERGALPWQGIDAGIDEGHLWGKWVKAKSALGL